MSDTSASWDEIADFIQEASRQMREYGLTKLHVEHAGSRIRLEIDKPRMVQVESVAGTPVMPTPIAVPAPLESSEQTVISPMIGTFYSCPSPGEPPFVQEGDLVEVGQVIGIIEAMKIMNEITSEFEGTISQIMVSNAQAVEYGQPLFHIAPVD